MEYKNGETAYPCYFWSIADMVLSKNIHTFIIYIRIIMYAKRSIVVYGLEKRIKTYVSALGKSTL